MTSSRSLYLFAVASLLAACSSTPVNAPGPAAPPAARPTPGVGTPAQSAAQRPAPASTVTSVTLPAYLDPKNSISTERSVYFDFDEFVVKTEYSALIDRHGKYLASSPSLAIKIEGHTDERGGSEYNLALGQKRAEAVLRALRIYGVKASQMEAISWGEERPMGAGHDEAAWAKNRRADLQYPKQ
jgi:peptidoglycan-associated lipoprotein